MAASQRRPTPPQQRYDHRWRRKRNRFLAHNPVCVLCGQPANHADHYPKSRKQLIAEGVPNPDDERYLRALCHSCHSRETARLQPGGWNARPPRRRPPEPHPGLLT